MRRTIALAVVVAATMAGPAALACGGLVAPNGAVQLARTTTLAAYQDGVEHYVTAFEFVGGGGRFGSIVPLPGVPTKIERGGEWTLQRLVRETSGGPETASVAAGSGGAAQSAKVIQRARVDALDLVVLEGGGEAVATWATENGFELSPDAPEVLSFYAERSPYFLAATFDDEGARERGQRPGDGTPVHLTIPTENPWVPLRILSLGKPGEEIVRADVYLLTERRPALLPVRAPGWTLERREPASRQLLEDLRSDEGMGWLRPEGMWLTHFAMDAPAGTLRYDLAADATGRGLSWEAAGLEPPPTPAPTSAPTPEPPTPEPTPALAPVPTDDGDVELVLAAEDDDRRGAWPVAAATGALIAASGLAVALRGRGLRGRRGAA